MHRIIKNIGETPLECLERFRRQMIESGKIEFRDIPMTYAGRLDPMASGELIILIGEECKNKDKYLSKNKEYEVEILFGVKTDSYDILGLCSDVKQYNIDELSKKINFKPKLNFVQKYPPYSSKTFKGKQLHDLARNNMLPEDEEMPSNVVSIFDIKSIDSRIITSDELFQYINEQVSKVKGDFRQQEIIGRWKEKLLIENTDDGDSQYNFLVTKIKVSCSSGAYMRVLANSVGEELGVGAIALSIHRTKIID